MGHAILAPVVALVAWTLLMLVWTIAARIPAMRKAGIDAARISGGAPGALDGVIADSAQYPAHNYMHLVEQPTLFYAICFALALEGIGGGINLQLAWAYVILRILHSLVQATFNRVLYRFILFALSTGVLMAMTVLAAVPFLHRL
jgi:hypothetical protein